LERGKEKQSVGWAVDNTTYEAVLFGYRASVAAASFVLITALVLAACAIAWAISLTWKRP
jgi:hypothetical protein